MVKQFLCFYCYLNTNYLRNLRCSHDIHPDTIEAVPLIIDEAHKLGFQFLTVSQMIRGDVNQ